MASKVWFPKESTIKIANAADVTITSLAALDTFFTSAKSIQGKIKDISFTEPRPDVDLINFHGTDSDGFQNQEGEEKPPALAEITVTAIFSDDVDFEAYIADSSAAISSTHTRYRYGKASVRRVAALLDLDDGTDAAMIAVDNGWLTPTGEVRSTGADGHFERTFAIKCLARDYYEDLKGQ